MDGDVQARTVAQLVHQLKRALARIRHLEHELSVSQAQLGQQQAHRDRLCAQDAEQPKAGDQSSPQAAGVSVGRGSSLNPVPLSVPAGSRFANAVGTPLLLCSPTVQQAAEQNMMDNTGTHLHASPAKKRRGDTTSGTAASPSTPSGVVRTAHTYCEVAPQGHVQQSASAAALPGSVTQTHTREEPEYIQSPSTYLPVQFSRLRCKSA